MKKITIALIMVISLIAPIQTMTESVTQNGTIIEPLEQNIEQIIDEITSEPRPINSDAIQNVKEYISEYFGNLGYDNIEYQKFEYNDENNENAIRHSSQADVFLASTAIMTVQKIRWAPMITVPEWQQCLNWQGF